MNDALTRLSVDAVDQASRWGIEEDDRCRRRKRFVTLS